MITTIAHVTMLVAALFALIAMLLWDLQNLQQSGYSNSRYNAWLRQSGEISSLKRLLVAAVLIGTFTTMAMASWMVEMVLAAVLVALGVSMLLKHPDRPLVFSSRVISVLIVALLIALIAIGAVFFFGQRLGQADTVRPAAMLAIMLIIISPLLTMLANYPFGNRPDYGPKDDKNDTKE